MLKRRQDGPPKFPISFQKSSKNPSSYGLWPKIPLRSLPEASKTLPRGAQEPSRGTCVRCQVSSMRCAQLRGCLVCKYQRESQTGVRCQASGVQCQVPGVKCQVPGARCQVSGVRCQVSGVRCQVPKRFETECWQSNCNFPVIHRTVYGLRASYMTC